MKFRTKKYDWLNSKTCKPKYGFKVFIGGEWCLAAENNKLLIFDTPEERDAAVKEFKDGS